MRNTLKLLTGTALALGHDLRPWASDYPDCYDLLEAAYTTLMTRTSGRTYQ